MFSRKVFFVSGSGEAEAPLSWLFVEAGHGPGICIFRVVIERTKEGKKKVKTRPYKGVVGTMLSTQRLQLLS